jgi:hypothetical protein
VREAFDPPASTRLLEGARGVQQLFSRLPLRSALVTTWRAAARSGVIHTRIRQGVTPPLTQELATVDQAIAWAISLYLALRQAGHLDDDALTLVEPVVVNTGIRLMRRAFPAMEGDHAFDRLAAFVVPALRYAERHGLYQLGTLRLTEERLSIEIERCHYLECCRVAGVPEVARCFCSVDVPFSCAGRLSDGDPACFFTFVRR